MILLLIRYIKKKLYFAEDLTYHDSRKSVEK